MNIFALDPNPDVAAQYHADRHVVKMVLESVQILCTAHHLKGVPSPGMYKPTHGLHPCVLWAMETTGNYLWLWNLAYWLAQEYSHRYGGKIHKSALLLSALGEPPGGIPPGPRLPWAQAMPPEYRVEGDGVAAYRVYYWERKRHLGKWTNRPEPSWLRNVAVGMGSIPNTKNAVLGNGKVP